MSKRRKLHLGMPLPSRPGPRDFMRFFAKIVVHEKTGCWLWNGHKDADGYGQFWYRGRSHWAHRWSKQAFDGAFPAGIQGDHECTNKACVHPDHIRGLTCSDNSLKRHGKFNGDTARRYAMGLEPAPF